MNLENIFDFFLSLPHKLSLGRAKDLFETMSLTLATAVILGAKIHKVPYFGTALPFAIISTGTFGCTAVCYKVRCMEKDTARRIRRSLQCNLFAVILIVQAVVFGFCYLHWHVYHTISLDELINYNVITACGLISPELCASICEFFTSVNCYPVQWLAQDSLRRVPHLQNLQNPVFVSPFEMLFERLPFDSVLNPEAKHPDSA
ncbi:PFP-BETA1 [Symbiodinium sp. CCMP2592]|nr:PFP-BETA1 [Symbiodinium sp. CCMP2592]